jgi:cytochrome b6-f complex iron-sulfur subunit
MKVSNAFSIAVAPTEGSTTISTRRKLVGALLGGGILASLASIFYPVLRYLVPPAETDLGADSVVAAAINELRPNSAKIFRFGSRPALLIRTSEGEYRAMSATCTHLSCTVQYRKDLQQIWCA